MARWLLAFAGIAALAAAFAQSRDAVRRIENTFADWNNANSAIDTIDSGLDSPGAATAPNRDRKGAFGLFGKDRAQWEQIYNVKYKDLAAALKSLQPGDVAPGDVRAVKVMRKRVASSPATRASTQGSLKPAAACRDASRKNLPAAALHDAMYACFDELGNQIEFEGANLTRLSALDLLSRIDDPSRRKALFAAFTPLWQAVNGNDEPDSPYRRMIALSGGKKSKERSPVAEAAEEAGAPPEQMETWLVAILSAWRDASRTESMEPWDFRYRGGEADRLLSSAIPRESLQPLSEHYYRDLGADLKTIGVLYDLDPRPGKAPLAYSDVARWGRMMDGAWQPTIPRVSANYQHGGLGALNELVHELGHAVHYAALRTRPAFMDVSALFTEAFADVTSWNTYDPAWQKKYLGRAAPEATSQRSLYTGVILDVAWSLFEIRMLRDPRADPNQVWTAITSQYLHIKPHPEYSWWAVRVQLVESPGYMLNYGIGGILTADMRGRIQEKLGPFETGNPKWYAFVSEHLLRWGLDRDTPGVLREFLGRPVSPDALIGQIRRIAPKPN